MNQSSEEPVHRIKLIRIDWDEGKPRATTVHPADLDYFLNQQPRIVCYYRIS